MRVWRWHFGEASGAERLDFDDSQWPIVELGFKWWPHDTTGWFRARIPIPETIDGVPVAGGPVLLRVGVDNAAQAYVNGEFRQEFEWSKGRFLLTEHARPGEVVTVALHAINRPGSGSLYEAHLMNGRAETMVDGLRGLLRDIDTSQQDEADVPAADSLHWRQRADQSLQALNFDAYLSCSNEVFLASVARARAILFSDRESMEQRLAQTKANLEAWQQRLQLDRANGRPVAYQTAEARLAERFLGYVRDDLAENLPRHQLRGLKGAAFVEQLASQALSASTPRDFHVPAYRTAPWELHDGAFWQNGRPVFFTGIGHFGQARQDIPILAELGFNIIQFEMGPANGLPAPGQVDLPAIREQVVRWLDLAASNHVAVNLLISPHYFPAWAIDADPSHRTCGYGFLKFCIEAPNTQVVMDQWLDALMPLIAHHPALHSICLSNEPQYQGRCHYDRVQFQKWLQAKWGSPTKMNQTYGTDFQSFDEVEIPTHAENYGLWLDRWRCNQERFLAFHERLRERIHRYDPQLPVHAKVMAHAFEEPGRFEEGIDYERFSQLDRIAGNDCVMAYTGDRSGPYACEWLTMAMNYALQHSVAPDSPIFNSENHLIGDGDTRYIPENYVHTVFWWEALHGQGATTTWVWERDQNGDLAENILTRVNAVHGFSRAALDLQRLAPEVYALSRARAPLAILYASASLLPAKDHADETRAAFEGAAFTGAPTDFITERQILEGGLASYSVVVVPHVSHVDPAVAQVLQHYLDGGGCVLAVGDCFTRDEYGRPQSKRLIPSRRGRLVVQSGSLAPRAYRDRLAKLLDERAPRGRVLVTDERKHPVWGVEARAVRQPGRWLVHLLNLTQSPLRVRLANPEARGSATNLLTGKSVASSSTLRPLEPVLLSFGAKN